MVLSHKSSLVLEVLKRFFKDVLKLAAVTETYFSLSNSIESSFLIKQFKTGSRVYNFTKTTRSAIHFPTFPKVEILERMEQYDK